MPATVRALSRPASSRACETRETVPAEVSQLLAARHGVEDEGEAAWTGFLSAYSGVLLEVAAAFAPGYDGALDRYTYILDELRRHDYQRLRRFTADGRGRFSTWLAVVARRLCLDHHRRRYGRSRRPTFTSHRVSASSDARRSLADLSGRIRDLERLEDPTRLDPTEALEATERRVALERALAALSPADRLLLRLRYEEDLNARDIALRLGFQTQFHVYRRLNAVRGLLRAEIQDLLASDRTRRSGRAADTV